MKQRTFPLMPGIIELDSQGEWFDCRYFCSLTCRAHYIEEADRLDTYSLSMVNDYIRGAQCEYCDKGLIVRYETDEGEG